LSVWTISGFGAVTSSTSSTTSAVASATPAVGSASYLGCYSDNTSGRSLTTSSTTDPSMTLELCAQTAQKLNLKYFGVEYAGECYAGYAIATTAGVIADSKCSMKCKGNSNEICGGPNALSMFQNNLFVQPANPALVNVTGSNVQYAYQGCFKEGTSGRAVGGSASTSYSTTNVNMTAELCVSTCFSEGFAYAGVEYSTECYCNNAGIVNGGSPAPGGDADCSMLCSGNKAEYCGGSSRVSVFKMS